MDEEEYNEAIDMVMNIDNRIQHIHQELVSMKMSVGKLMILIQDFAEEDEE